MRRKFKDRSDLVEYVRQEFPQAAAVSDSVSNDVGGRREAEARLLKINPQRYAKSRNFLQGAVTRLSPYIRHGVLSLNEIKNQVSPPKSGQKLIQELGWRDYFRRVFQKIGREVWHDREPYKTGFSAQDYAKELPEDIQNGTTGLACIDGFSQELRQTGYLHNHARMWLAAYIVHWRHIRWQAGARWFLQHLLDGDPASNNLSWQWVASTFSHKPYFFNRENLEKFSDGKYCRGCPLAGRCDFEGSYPELEKRLFPHKPPQDQPSRRRPKKNQRKKWHQK